MTRVMSIMEGFVMNGWIFRVVVGIVDGLGGCRVESGGFVM